MPSDHQRPADQRPADQSGSEQGFPDEITTVGDESNVYETIATLEYLGQPVGKPEIVAATALSEERVSESLSALIERGLLIERQNDDGSRYEPTNRGWSAAPEQATGP
jgi:predicted transcriptional regulator